MGIKVTVLRSINFKGFLKICKSKSNFLFRRHRELFVGFLVLFHKLHRKEGQKPHGELPAQLEDHRLQDAKRLQIPCDRQKSDRQRRQDHRHGQDDRVAFCHVAHLVAQGEHAQEIVQRRAADHAARSALGRGGKLGRIVLLEHRDGALAETDRAHNHLVGDVGVHRFDTQT